VDGLSVPRAAQTMAFTTLTLFQILNVLNARSNERSAFRPCSRTRGCAQRRRRPGRMRSHRRIALPADGHLDWRLLLTVSRYTAWMRPGSCGK
jgi:hypothetical protein